METMNLFYFYEYIIRKTYFISIYICKRGYFCIFLLYNIVVYDSFFSVIFLKYDLLAICVTFLQTFPLSNISTVKVAYILF
jgi:hypothetical protein